ncbi:hypothetical protein GTO91_06105 [Heliobacterium undosum]|uniref:4Fe-4S ferredoxin-type domain-containing protein n=1 Tax=Heliomicrobium undosum TaxID=121734 RepID=A0A845L2G9_9FIRM|nr:4Fe-4S binding protein [Heliomicrobium undosum]MZP29279.1 hypothetical protein [Heliomicrobium undosum]
MTERLQPRRPPFDVTSCRGSASCAGDAPGRGGGCPHMILDPGDLAGRISVLLRRRLNAHQSHSAHNVLRVALSGCPNSCSQPQIRDFGLQARSPVEITESPCLYCGACIDACPERFVELTDAGPRFSDDCLSCGRCVKACPSGTLRNGAPGWTLLAGGKLGRIPRLAVPIGHYLDDDDVMERIEAILTAYLDADEGEEAEKDDTERRTAQRARVNPRKPGERLRTWLDRTKWAANLPAVTGKVLAEQTTDLRGKQKTSLG